MPCRIFYDRHPKFDNTTVSSKEIARLLKDTNHLITLIDWKPSLLQAQTKFKKTNAVTGNKDIIKMNILKYDRPVEEIAGTIIHEGVHAIDFAHKEVYFGHKNSENIKETAPYRIGSLAINILRGTYEPDKPFKYFLEDED